MEFANAHSILLLLAVLLPLGAGSLLFLAGRWPEPGQRAVALAGFGGPFVIAAGLLTVFDPDPVTGYDFISRIDTGLDMLGISLKLGLNGISLPMFLLAGTVGLAAGLYAMRSNAERRHLYLALMLIMLGGLMGVFASIDLFFFYFFHEFALIPTFLMIGVWGGSGRRSAAIEMTLYLSLGALISLLGLIGLYLQSGAESFSVIALREQFAIRPLSEVAQNGLFPLLLFGFGILVSLFPFHSWAPRGYAAAPTGAAMLHAGVLKKFGLYGLIQIGAPMLPVAAFDWSGPLVWLALGNILVIGLVTVAQRDLKLMLGYSSVMHMGYLFLGVAALSVVGAGGAVLLMVGHGLSVALLFMLATCIYHRSQTFDMLAMGGMAQNAPVLAAFFVAATMASIGLPGFANFWGEFTIFAALAETEATRWLLAPAVLGIVISAIYGLRAVARVFFGPSSEAFRARIDAGEVVDMRAFEKVPAALLVAGLAAVGVFPGPLAEPANATLQNVYEPLRKVEAERETAATAAAGEAGPGRFVRSEKTSDAQP